ncbi:MAG: hypothetical protein LBM94_02400 [Propionibacteriaceae bacterium]|nr:hypothetical protein [Propionibacteriaceae bacterium]
MAPIQEEPGNEPPPWVEADRDDGGLDGLDGATAVLDPHDWVQAAPFRAMAHRLVADSELNWQAVAIGTNIPLRTMRSLLGLSAGRPPRRIRRVDARRLMAVTAQTLKSVAGTHGDAIPARLALLDLPFYPSPTVLARIASTDVGTAAGLLNGWIERCPLGVIWRIQAFAQEQHAAMTADYLASPRPRQEDIACPECLLAEAQAHAEHEDCLALAA